jgi:3-hydroxyisobutyrate dehydrogenase-like beta-hydroxyacid dehydrogenase
MGSAIAERLEQRGAGLHVFDPNEKAMAPFLELGAIGAASPKAVADVADIVFACLPNGDVSQAVAPQVAEGRAVRVYVEMSTIGGPALAKVEAAVGARGIPLVDCPISGGPKGARAGTLTVICAGAPENRARVMPWLQRIGARVFEVGDA